MDAGDITTFSTSRTAITLKRSTNGPLPAQPAGSEPFEIDYRGHTIRGIDLPGSAPAVVLLHGFPDNLHLYDNVYPLLAGKRRVIAFDFIGWGTSDKPLPGDVEYTMEANQHQIETVLDTLAPGPSTLVLHDASGIPGLDVSIQRPELVASLVLLNTFYGLGPTPPTAIAIFSDPGMQSVENALNLDPTASELLYRNQVGQFIVDPDLRATFVDRLWAQFPDAVPAFIALNDVLFPSVVARNQQLDQLSRIGVPVRIAVGARDTNLTVAVAEDFARLIPHAELTIINTAGHFPQIDTPELVVASILG